MQSSFLRKGHVYFAVLIVLLFSVISIGCSSGNNEAADSKVKEGANSQATDSQNKEDSKYGGTVKIRFHQTPRSIGFPATMSPPSNAVPVGQPALESLGRFNPDGTMGPLLAEKWETDPKAKTITVFLRKGVKFHDGTDFNAEAVKWNIEQVLAAKRPLAGSVERVEVVDANTVRFHLKQWGNSTVNDLLWTYPMASPAAFEKLGKDGMTMHPVGTGPFKFDSMQNDSYIKYVKNENYWQKGLPYLDGIEFKIIIDPNTALNSFLAKEVDLALQVSGDLVDTVKDQKDIELVKPETQIGLVGGGLIGNSSDPKSPFADVRVRKAIDYAINKAELASALFKGYAEPSNQFGLPGSWSYDPDIDPYAYNPEKAKQLLAEAGYANGFKTKLTVHSNHRAWIQAVQGYLAEVGIDAEVNIVEPARYNAMAMTDGWDGLIGYFYSTDNELSSIVTTHFGPNSAIYGTHSIRPEKVQKLNDQFNAETNPEARKKLAQELQRAIFDEYHMVTSLFVTTTPYLKHPYVQDDGFYTATGMVFSPEKMWIKK